MKIKLNHKRLTKYVGGIRLDDETLKKLETMCKKHNVSKQFIIREVMKQSIDNLELI